MTDLSSVWKRPENPYRDGLHRNMECEAMIWDDGAAAMEKAINDYMKGMQNRIMMGMLAGKGIATLRQEFAFVLEDEQKESSTKLVDVSSKLVDRGVE